MPPAAHSWPELDDSRVKALAQTFHAFYASDMVADTQAPIETLIQLTGCAVPPTPPERTIWACFEQWTRVARSPAEMLAIVRIGLFVETYHDDFAPQAGNAVFGLGRATDRQREVITKRAFELCAELNGGEVVRADDQLTVRELQNHWATTYDPPAAPADAAERRAADTAAFNQMLDEAEAGDEAKQAMVAAVMAKTEGRLERALQLLEHAAGLGNVDAMLGAAMEALELGDPDKNRHWNEQAAAAGSPQAKFNLGVIALQGNRLDEATQRFESAAAAGNAEAYAGLIEVAERQGYAPAARRWAELGARQGQPRCLEVYALAVLRDDPEEPANQQRAMELMEQAAKQGYASAMDYCGMFQFHSGNRTQARYWLEKAVDAGDPNAGERLKKYGLG